LKKTKVLRASFATMARHTEVDVHIKDLIVRSGLPLDILETASQGGGSQAPSRNASFASDAGKSSARKTDDIKAGLTQNQFN
jgi:hypothetical protein